MCSQYSIHVHRCLLHTYMLKFPALLQSSRHVLCLNTQQATLSTPLTTTVNRGTSHTYFGRVFHILSLINEVGVGYSLTHRTCILVMQEMRWHTSLIEVSMGLFELWTRCVGIIQLVKNTVCLGTKSHSRQLWKWPILGIVLSCVESSL